jgi:hypothetical protein
MDGKPFYADLVAELEQCALELEEAAKVLAVHFPAVASIYVAAGQRTRRAVAKARGESKEVVA